MTRMEEVTKLEDDVDAVDDDIEDVAEDDDEETGEETLLDELVPLANATIVL